MTTLDQYIDSRIYNGTIWASLWKNMAMSEAGCPYRGTSVCHSCKFEPAALCEYRCRIRISDCEWRAVCKCGWDQTERLRAWGLVE